MLFHRHIRTPLDKQLIIFHTIRFCHSLLPSNRTGPPQRNTPQKSTGLYYIKNDVKARIQVQDTLNDFNPTIKFNHILKFNHIPKFNHKVQSHTHNKVQLHTKVQTHTKKFNHTLKFSHEVQSHTMKFNHTLKFNHTHKFHRTVKFNHKVQPCNKVQPHKTMDKGHCKTMLKGVTPL